MRSPKITGCAPRPARIALALLLTTPPLISCSATASSSVAESGAAIGRISAQRTLPEAPPDFRKVEPHVSVPKDQPPSWALLLKEGLHVDNANARGRACVEFYDAVKASQEKVTQ